MSTPIDPPLSRRAARQAELSAHGAQPEEFAQPETRRGRGGTPISVPSSAPTDVAYRTQVRPRVPHYDAPPDAHTVVPGAVPQGSVPPPVAPPPVAPPSDAPVAPPATTAPVRRRDFRPPAEQAPVAPVPPPGFDTELQYHTQLAPRRDAPPPAPAPPSAPPAHVIELPRVAPSPGPSTLPPAPAEPYSAPVEQTLSRRELRALREQAGFEQGSVAPPAEAPPAPPAAVPPVAAPALPAFTAPTVPPAPLIEPAAIPVPTATATVGSAPTGSHWSVGIHADDELFVNTLSREVGSVASSTSTNALVLPEMPSGSIAGPVTGTGEIIITGMIDLPRTVSSTGTVPTVHESPDIDDLFEPGELSAAPPDAAPISASRAVSSHTQTHSIIAPAPRRVSSNTVTTVLVGATVVMAVVAIGLFVIAAANGLF